MAKLLVLAFALGGSVVVTMCTSGDKASTGTGEGGSLVARNAAPIPPQRRTNVTRLYEEACAKCHGQNGEGGSAKTLNTRAKFSQDLDRAFFDAIKDGVPSAGMEAYGQTMTDEEVWGLVVHIREMQARSLRREFGSPRAENGVYRSQYHSFRLEDVVPQNSGLQTPWGIDWLPDGRALVTNRPGYMFVLTGKQMSPRIEGLPAVRELGQGGLMDVAVHPNYRTNGWIYLAYTEPKRSNPNDGMTKIVRGKLRFESGTPVWYGQQTIWESPQEFYNGAGVHFGSRIVFDGKGKIFFAVGERGGNMMAQELTNPFGKIFRVNEDGTVPGDNPFVGKSPFPGIWTYGHRNPQGLVMLPDGSLWDTEHGPRGGDEVNRIDKGSNYGWPVVAYSINYNDSPFQTPWPKGGLTVKQPAFRWLPSIGASGLDVGKGKAFAKWNGDLLAGGLSGANLDRIRVSNGKLVEREELLQGMGRVRDVAVGPDGFVYVVLNGPDRIFRLVPTN